MHLYTLFLIGAWVLGSGLIAYVCDNMGRKLGKKRLSLWGLRPRHTAMLITVITGIGIAAVTVGLVSLAVPDARTALFRVRAIRQEAETLATRIDNLNQRQKDLNRRNRSLIRSNLVLDSRVRESERKADLAKGELTQAEAQRDRVKSALAVTQTRLSRLQSSRDRLASEVKARQRRLAELTGVLERSRRQLSIAEQSAERSRSEESKALAEAEEARKRVASLQKQIANETLKLGGLTTELNAVTASLEETQKELVARKRQLENAKVDFLVAASSSVAMRQKRLLYSTDQEIARRVVYNPENDKDVTLQIVKLLEAADEEARSRGAVPPTPGSRAVELASSSYMGEGDKTEIILQESDQILRYSQLIVSEKKDVVIRLVAAANTFRGEPVQAKLQVILNSLVFKRGAVIAKDEIDGRLSEAEIMDSLVRLLVAQVRQTAYEKGMLESPPGSMGGINWGQLLDAMHEIKARNAVSEVQIISQTDAWTADPLTVRFALQS